MRSPRIANLISDLLQGSLLGDGNPRWYSTSVGFHPCTSRIGPETKLFLEHCERHETLLGTAQPILPYSTKGTVLMRLRSPRVDVHPEVA